MSEPVQHGPLYKTAVDATYQNINSIQSVVTIQIANSLQQIINSNFAIVEAALSSLDPETAKTLKIVIDSSLKGPLIKATSRLRKMKPWFDQVVGTVKLLKEDPLVKHVSSGNSQQPQSTEGVS